MNFGNCEAEQTLSVHISCVHYQTALPRSVNDSVCLRLLLALSHTHHPLSIQATLSNYFLIFTPSPSSLALSLICFISLYLAFIPAYLFPSLSPPYLSLDTAGNKSLCCNFAILKACNDGAQRMAEVEV